MDTALQIKNLSKWYGAARGVEALSLSIAPGEIFGYLGPNGAGKTTTIRCLMGMLRPSAGECRVLGERVEPGRATRHARIGYLPGDFRAWPELTPRRALTLLEALGGRRGGAGRREELAERLGLALDRRLGDLSKGNRQKTGLIAALQHRPDLLILDEPTSGLDPLVRQTALDLIREAAREGAAVMLSSHDLDEVAATCGRAGILREGRLVELAPISQIVRQVESRLTVWFAAGTPAPEFPEGQMPGARVAQCGEGWMELAYHGSADPLLKWLAQWPVERIVTPRMTLQDAFFHYYYKESGAAGRGVGDDGIDRTDLADLADRVDGNPNAGGDA